ncbi:MULTISPECIES: metallophosphoesterase family protein [Bradyrhizobium]|uniref:metallophosphoesterase family protein n=1 Tax=Bradyrhizobium TaxID=374 RepID=UPI0003F714CE|nr:metallophosphoesterase family protein [Bradyrhizobium sp. SEMIA]
MSGRRCAHHPAGDIGAVDIIDRLRRIAPVTAIRGNVDIGDWASVYPATQTVQIGRHCFYILHDVAELEDRLAPNNVDAVIYGHSHKVSVKTMASFLSIQGASARGASSCR